MRNALVTIVCLLSATVTAEYFSPFLPPTVEDVIVDGNDTEPAVELIRRQNGCASGYSNCFGQGAPGLCCKPNSVCSADSGGHVGCCPVGAVCTGTIGQPTAAGGPTSGISGLVPATTSNNVPLTTTQAFVFPSGTATITVAGVNTAARSTVPNPYYPFPFIATTYTNAAACSSAYTGCQTDYSSCTGALTGGVHGVTVAAPNGGITVAAVTGSLDANAASSICSSLSSQACYGLQVAACQAYGTGNAGAVGTGAGSRRGCGLYGIGAGVALGVAGQVLAV
jgi:hypothetical protein